jgi:hypothetical protein
MLSPILPFFLLHTIIESVGTTDNRSIDNKKINELPVSMRKKYVNDSRTATKSGACVNADMVYAVLLR